MEEIYTEKLLIKAAAQLFYENGYEKTTLRQIADKVGIQAPSIYYYFKSKEDMGIYFTEAFFKGYQTIGTKLFSENSAIFNDNYNEFLYSHCLYYKLLLTDEKLRNLIIEVFKLNMTKISDFASSFGQSFGERLYGKPLDTTKAQITISYPLASRMDIVLAELYGNGQITIYDAAKYSYSFFIKMVFNSEFIDSEETDEFIRKTIDNFDISNFDLINDFLLSLI